MLLLFIILKQLITKISSSLLLSNVDLNKIYIRTRLVHKTIVSSVSKLFIYYVFLNANLNKYPCHMYIWFNFYIIYCSRNKCYFECTYLTGACNNNTAALFGIVSARPTKPKNINRVRIITLLILSTNK